MTSVPSKGSSIEIAGEMFFEEEKLTSSREPKDMDGGREDDDCGVEMDVDCADNDVICGVSGL